MLQDCREPEPITIHQAKWVLPITAPVIIQGAVAVAGSRIVAVGPVAAVKNAIQARVAAAPQRWHDHGEGAILPALVNTHVHLEFTALAGSIPPQSNLPAWLRAAMAGRAALNSEAVVAGIQQGLAELHRYGTGLVGEVSNTGDSLPWLAASDVAFHYFYECLGFDLLQSGPLEVDFPFLARPEAEVWPVSAAAHAPYSVSAPLCQRLTAWNRARGRPNAVHLAESPEETEFLQQGRGPFRELLEARGRWYEGFQPPGCGPAQYLEQLGFWQHPSLAVHGVYLSPAERELLARRGVFLALCPRSNLHTGVGLPDLLALRAAGVKLTLGTDSRASTADMNLFQDMRLLQEAFPAVPTAELLAMATWHGAQALGRHEEFGSLKPGARAALLFVPIPAGTEFWSGLLAAGAQGEISWLNSHGREKHHGT